MQIMCTGEGSTDKIRRGKIAGKLCWLCWGLLSANVIRWIEGNGGTESRTQEKKVTLSNNFLSGFVLHVYIWAHQWSSSHHWFQVKLEKKQDKHLNNNNFPLHLPHQTKNHSGYPRYAASIWYSIHFQWVFRMQLIEYGRGGITKSLGNAESTLEGIKCFYKNWSTCGMVERLVRYLAIEDALQN